MKIYRSADLGVKELSEKLNSDTTLQFFSDEKTGEELLSSDYDIIELSEKKGQEFLKLFNVLDWDIQASHAVDAFVRRQGLLKPYHLGSHAILTYLEGKSAVVDNSKCAMLVGDYSFLVTYAIALSKMGYKKVYLVFTGDSDIEAGIALLRKMLFDVELSLIRYDEIAELTDLSSLLILDFDKANNSELVEILTYFNFMSVGAHFLDLRQFIDESLKQEAEKAMLSVIDSLEFHSYKYKLLQKK